MLRYLLVLSVAVLAFWGCEPLPETVVPSEKAQKAAKDWLVPFAHSNPEYLDMARSAFSYV